MDIENDYFLAKLQSLEDYNKVITQGPWIIYGQYLIVQPWINFFNPKKPYLNVVLAWTRLSSLLSFMYKKRILEAVGGLVGKVAKLDFNSDSKTKGCFYRMAIFVDLDKPLYSLFFERKNKLRAFTKIPCVHCFSMAILLFRSSFAFEITSSIFWCLRGILRESPFMRVRPT
ncbi:hypothetical protein Goshw_019315 [Gossypium schwendimanii]|uniref:DUF4283 domain-containing protein n=1 Tax=Gossypium schwendimanii TaxID=34291 RepID=A0A7J9MD99_GOSSC|nr:hypothetical protein [Gossypium schwendimanii]